MSPWLDRLRGLAIGLLMSGLFGCVQPTHSECDWQHIYQQAMLPPRLENQSDELAQPKIPDMADPATVLNPERTPYHLSLPEAFALALENGTTGITSVRNPGFSVDDLVALGSGGVVGSDSIRVLSFDPARAGAQIEAALSRFDPLWTTGTSWTATDQPNLGLTSTTNGNGANLFSTLAKPLSTGGAVGVTFNTNYQTLSNPPPSVFGVLSPSYTPSVTLGFEQPLLRGAGVDINQLLPTLPTSILFPNATNRLSSTGTGILIARLRFDQQRAELERSVNYLILNVEAAYWTLYGSYVNLYVTEQGLRQAHMAWMLGKAQLEGGKIDRSQLAQIQGQYEQFRGDRTKALGTILTNERNLRVLLGQPVEDGRRLVPIDAPNILPTQPQWKEALNDALTRRPELVLARQDIKTKNWNLAVQKNYLLPDLRFQASNTLTGLGTRLDGNGNIVSPTGEVFPSNALHSLTSGNYNSWNLGLTLNVPLGFRYEHAQVRDARLALAQSYMTLKNQEQKATTFLAKQYSTVIQNHKLIEIRRQQRLAQSEQVDIRFRKYAAGVKDSPLEFLLAAQQQWTSALSQEYQAIVDYNISLALFEFAKGTILTSNNINITEGSLPECALTRATEHERRRSTELEKEQAAVARLTPTAPDQILPSWPETGAPSLIQIEKETATPVQPPVVIPASWPSRAPEPTTEQPTFEPPTTPIRLAAPLTTEPTSATPNPTRFLAPEATPWQR